MSEKSARRLELSITAAFVLALLLVGAVLIFTGGEASAKQIATLHLFGGTVDVRQGGSGDFQPATEGASLHEGDTVRTGPAGRAYIVYFDGSLTRLDYDTTFTLVTLETLNNASDSKVIEGKQGEGSSFHRVAELTDAESRFEIETPTATASIQGTVYALIVEGGVTTVAVVDGVVQTTGAGGSVTVPAGMMVSVDASGSIGAVQNLSADMLSTPWLSFNLCEVDHDDACVEGDSGEPPTESAGPNPEKGDRSQQQPPATINPTPPSAGGGGGGGGGGNGNGNGDGDGLPPPNAPPTARFTAKPDEGPAPLHVRFADTSSDPNGDPISRHWSFGDGSSRNGGTSPTHTFRDPGTYTVTLTIRDPDGATDHTSKVIDVGSPSAGFDHIVISPSNATIRPGGSQIYAAEAFDTRGKSMGSVTANTSFSIAPNGSCTGNACTATQPGDHTVTGTFSGDSDSATLEVEEPLPPPCPKYALAFQARPPDSIEAGKHFTVQVRVDVLRGGSTSGPLTISLSLSGGGFSGGDTSETWTGQGTKTFDDLSIDRPGSYSITASAACASSTDAAPITVTDDDDEDDDGDDGGDDGNDGGDDDDALGLVFLIPGIPASRRQR